MVGFNFGRISEVTGACQVIDQSEHNNPNKRGFTSQISDRSITWGQHSTRQGLGCGYSFHTPSFIHLLVQTVLPIHATEYVLACFPRFTTPYP